MSGGKVTVVGNPNLSQIKTIMIGVRNPKKESIESFRRWATKMWANMGE